MHIIYVNNSIVHYKKTIYNYFLAFPKIPKFNQAEIIVMLDTDEKFMHAAKMILIKHNPSLVDTF